MTDEQTNETDTAGTKNDTSSQEPVSIYDKTEAIVARQEEANKKTEELLARQEKLYANQRLAGISGGPIETKPKEETPAEYNERIEKEILEGKL